MRPEPAYKPEPTFPVRAMPGMEAEEKPQHLSRKRSLVRLGAVWANVARQRDARYPVVT